MMMIQISSQIEVFEADEISEEEPDDEQPSANAINSHTTENINDQYYKGKNGFKWNSKECPIRSRTAAHNIIRLPGRLRNPNFEGYFQLWSKIFDSSILECLVTYTNQKLYNYRIQFKQSTKIELMDTNVTEMKAFIGVIFYSSVFKCNDADLSMIFATDGLQMFFLFSQLSTIR